jgi:NAD(P)H-quinone oxidoreductase subunit H
MAINWSLSGPMLRASGVPWDLRKVDHYECYDDFDWAVAWENEGDCFARYRVRVQEMRESLKIVRQACQMIPGGPTENLEAQRMAEGKGGPSSAFDFQYVAKKVAPTFKIPSGELYTRLESGKGEIGVYIQGNDDVTPWRFKIRAADFNNLQILPHILKGAKVADIMAILGSIDVIMGSVDR